MFNFFYDSTDKDFKLRELSSSEKVLYWTIVLTPLWWLLGIQTLLYPAVAAFLLITNLDIDKITKKPPLPICVWAWLAMALVMAWTALFGLQAVGFGFQKIASTGVTFLKSYFLIFACMALPFLQTIRLQVVTRAVSWMSIGYLITIGIELLLLFAGITGSFIPPLARLLPGDRLSLKVTLAEFQPFFGVPLPRTVLYTPDPPILGVCTLLCFFICLGETNTRLRKFALAGCAIALVMSFSRSAWVCFPLALLIATCFRSRWIRQSSLWGTSLTFLLCSFLGLTISQLTNSFQEFFNSARAESSSDREFVVRKTLEAWQQSPWLGWGIIRGSVKWYIYDIALGSFSTYASVLYLHGIVGFIVFIFALASTLWSFWTPALRGNPLCARAVATLVALYILCTATPLTWMTVYFWFFFLWLGAILAEIHEQDRAITRWEQLSERPGYF